MCEACCSCRGGITWALEHKGWKELRCLNSGTQDKVCWVEVGQNPGAPPCALGQSLLAWAGGLVKEFNAESLMKTEGRIFLVTSVK